MYGWDTKSWRNSTENRQQKQACAEATKAYTASQPQPDSIPVRVQCACPSPRVSPRSDGSPRRRIPPPSHQDTMNPEGAPR